MTIHLTYLHLTGQLEITMMNSFCAFANLRTFLDSPRCPDYLKPCKPIMEQCYAADKRGTLMNDIRVLENQYSDTAIEDLKPWAYDNEKLQPLETDIQEAVLAASTTSTISNIRNAIFHPCYTIGGLQYTPYTVQKKDSTIFFQTGVDENSVPGRIRQILSMPQCTQDAINIECVFLAVQRYKLISDGIEDPFKNFGDFGAALWSSDFKIVEIIGCSAVGCYGILRRWADGMVVLRPLNRVSWIDFL